MYNPVVEVRTLGTYPIGIPMALKVETPLAELYKGNPWLLMRKEELEKNLEKYGSYWADETIEISKVLGK